MLQRAQDYSPLPADGDADSEEELVDNTGPKDGSYKRSQLYIFVVSLLVNLIALAWIVWDETSGEKFLAWRGPRAQYSEWLLGFLMNERTNYDLWTTSRSGGHYRFTSEQCIPIPNPTDSIPWAAD